MSGDDIVDFSIKLINDNFCFKGLKYTFIPMLNGPRWDTHFKRHAQFVEARVAKTSKMKRRCCIPFPNQKVEQPSNVIHIGLLYGSIKFDLGKVLQLRSNLTNT